MVAASDGVTSEARAKARLACSHLSVSSFFFTHRARVVEGIE
jgi:hypothetical protein